MWKYLVLNNLWFSILFLVHFVGSEKDRRLIFISIFALATYLAVKTPIDPFAWGYYVVFSALVFYGAHQFRQWVYARSVIVEDEIDLASRELGRSQHELTEKTLEAELLERRAAEITGLYDKVKEMSRSLDQFEVFLIFGEALAENFEFQTLKLVRFDEENLGMIRSEEVYELTSQDFQGIFDRKALLKNRERVRSTLFSGETKIFNHIFKTQKAMLGEDFRQIFSNPLMQDKSIAAYPMLVNRKIFSILMLTGLKARNVRLLNILIERFVSEMERVKLYESVETLAITDGLTGVYVRRHLMDRLMGELDRSKRFGFKLSFLMIDIDYFKRFNDNYGHLVGDVVLKQVADSIKSSVREVDMVGRYGGEEFAVLLIETDENLAMMVAERIRRSIEERAFKAYDEKLKVTVSIGCSTYAYYDSTDAAMIIDAADSALYQAKRQGRNRVCLYNLPSETK